MADTFPLKDDYRLAKCCSPIADNQIVGFLKIDSPVISVHKRGCVNLEKVASDRLVSLTWDEITNNEVKSDLTADSDFQELDETDFKILKHHQVMGNDYAAVVAKMTLIPRATVFERHKKLRNLKLLKRVEPKMIQYRKGIAKNKWIKHRNHTYYELTVKGTEFVDYYFSRE